MEFKYFKLSEFDSPDEPGSGEKNMDKNFVELLDKARGYAQVPFKITSGYRTQAYHDDLTRRGYKTSKTSAHLKGLAADISTRDSKTRWAVINSLIKFGAKRIGIGETFIHVDIDSSRTEDVMWTYY